MKCWTYMFCFFFFSSSTVDLPSDSLQWSSPTTSLYRSRNYTQLVYLCSKNFGYNTYSLLAYNVLSPRPPSPVPMFFPSPSFSPRLPISLPPPRRFVVVLLADGCSNVSSPLFFFSGLCGRVRLCSIHLSSFIYYILLPFFLFVSSTLRICVSPFLLCPRPVLSPFCRFVCVCEPELRWSCVLRFCTGSNRCTWIINQLG